MKRLIYLIIIAAALAWVWDASTTYAGTGQGYGTLTFRTLVALAALIAWSVARHRRDLRGGRR